MYRCQNGSGGFSPHMLFRWLLIIICILVGIHVLCYITGLSSLTVIIIAAAALAIYLYVIPNMKRKKNMKGIYKSRTSRSEFMDLD